jgi:hypothetical protein
VNFRIFITGQKHFRFGAWTSVLRRVGCALLGLAAIALGLTGLAHAQQAGSNPGTGAPPANATESGKGDSTQQAAPQMAGNIHGVVADKTGTLLAGVRVRMTGEGQTNAQETTSGEDGQFSFANVAPGNFQLRLTAPDYAPQNYSGTLQPGENLALPQMTLTLATAVTEVRVEENTVEIAQEQIQEQEKQRVLGVIPNFYVTYEADAAPLNTRQKFELAWKSTVDPVTFLVNAGVAGTQQASDAFSGYGQGAQGYAKRYGASYGDTVTGTFIGSAILPSLLKQDPRYFYKGTGTFGSRFWYAIAMSVMCKGDNGKWQFNYSGLFGGLAAGGISNLYYPDTDRGVALTFENFGVGIGATAGVNLLQEFVLRKLTPHMQKQGPANP